jgi:hypothetical protein
MDYSLEPGHLCVRKNTSKLPQLEVRSLLTAQRLLNMSYGNKKSLYSRHLADGMKFINQRLCMSVQLDR